MRVVVVGLGIQGNKRRAIAGEEVVATVDPYKAEATYRNIDEVPIDRYDAALVCTQDNVKHEILTYLLSHGKHVLVEKPLMSDKDEDLCALEKLAQRNRVVCYTAYNHRFEPFLVRAREVLQRGDIGPVLSLRMFYGNGTAREVRNSSWRDAHMGVLADLGSHLLDTTEFLLDEKRDDLVPFSFYTLENKAYDYVLFGSASKTPKIHLEATLLSWRNTFTLDIIGEKGSLHIDCLCKWGPSTITVRTRVLPSGRPLEQKEILECKDPTWAAEYLYFKELVLKKSGGNISTDRWINRVLHSLFTSFERKGSS